MRDERVRRVLTDDLMPSLESKRITGVVCTFDLRERDAEVRLRLDCTPEEGNDMLSFLNKRLMAAILVAKDDDTDRD